MRRAGLQEVRLKERRDIGAAVTIAQRPTSGQKRRFDRASAAPLLPNNRTFSGSLGMSQKCQHETHALQQMATLFDHLVGAGEGCRR